MKVQLFLAPFNLMFCCLEFHRCRFKALVFSNLLQLFPNSVKSASQLFYGLSFSSKFCLDFLHCLFQEDFLLIICKPFCFLSAQFSHFLGQTSQSRLIKWNHHQRCDPFIFFINFSKFRCEVVFFREKWVFSNTNFSNDDVKTIYFLFECVGSIT